MDRRRATWPLCLVLLCLTCIVVVSQDVGDVSSASSDAGASDNTSSPPSTTTSATTAPVTTIPATTAPSPITTSITVTPITETPPSTTKMPTTSTPSTSTTSKTPTPTPTTKTTASSSAAETTAPTATKAASSTSTTSDSSSTTDTKTLSPTSTTAAPEVKNYNSSTLPPGLSSSVLNGSDLVAVEVTEPTLGNGSTSYSYIIVTDAGETEKVVVVSPTTDHPTTSSTSSDGNSGSTSSDSSTNSKSPDSMGIGSIIGIIVGVLLLMLALFGFLVVRHRRNKNKSKNESSDAVFALPAVGKQVRLLDQNQSMVDTEYEDATRTLPHSHSSGISMLSSGRYRATMWEHPVIVASRIPIDHIELGDIISRGAFGVVYQGSYRDQDVAVKTLLPEKRKDMAHIEVFLSEVKLMATMEHPNIVHFIGVAWEALSELYCVTEYMSGGDLRSLLMDYFANGAPQGMNATKMQIAYDVAYALTYLHSLDPVVLHRDLKSRNILLTGSLAAKIMDFGTSRIRSDGSMTSNVGSSLWMAPEVMMGRRYDEKADVFSLGVVISELDTHELPYSLPRRATTTRDVHFRIRQCFRWCRWENSTFGSHPS